MSASGYFGVDFRPNRAMESSRASRSALESATFYQQRNPSMMTHVPSAASIAKTIGGDVLESLVDDAAQAMHCPDCAARRARQRERTQRWRNIRKEDRADVTPF